MVVDGRVGGAGGGLAGALGAGGGGGGGADVAVAGVDVVVAGAGCGFDGAGAAPPPASLTIPTTISSVTPMAVPIARILPLSVSNHPVPPEPGSLFAMT